MSTVKTDIYIDPENELICLRSVDETDAVIPTLPQIRLKLADLQYADQIDEEHAIEMICRRIHFTDSRSGAKKRCYGVFTVPEDDSTDDGHSDAVEDLYLGGAGALTLMTLVSFNGTYLVCADDASVNHNVALQPELRSSIGSQDFGGGEVWTYSYSGQGRTASYGTVSESQVITPRFLAGDKIPVWGCSNTGVTLSGTPLTLIAITGREWAAAAPTP